MQYQKKLISIFKTFIQKNLIPQIKKADGSLNQWNKFNQKISSQNINFTQLQFYVDSLPNINNMTLGNQIPNTYEKSRSGGNNNQLNPDSLSRDFNPSRTFNGNSAKMVLTKMDLDDFNTTQKKDYDFSSNSKEDPYKKNLTNSNQSIVSSLQKFYKQILQNQTRIEAISNGGNGGNGGNNTSNNGYTSLASDYKSYY